MQYLSFSTEEEAMARSAAGAAARGCQTDSPRTGGPGASIPETGAAVLLIDDGDACAPARQPAPRRLNGCEGQSPRLPGQIERAFHPFIPGEASMPGSSSGRWPSCWRPASAVRGDVREGSRGRADCLRPRQSAQGLAAESPPFSPLDELSGAELAVFLELTGGQGPAAQIIAWVQLHTDVTLILLFDADGCLIAYAEDTRYGFDQKAKLAREGRDRDCPLACAAALSLAMGGKPRRASRRHRRPLGAKAA